MARGRCGIQIEKTSVRQLPGPQYELGDQLRKRSCTDLLQDEGQGDKTQIAIHPLAGRRHGLDRQRCPAYELPRACKRRGAVRRVGLWENLASHRVILHNGEQW